MSSGVVCGVHAGNTATPLQMYAGRQDDVQVEGSPSRRHVGPEPKLPQNTPRDISVTWEYVGISWLPL